jgi:hypothetical protein
MRFVFMLGAVVGSGIYSANRYGFDNTVRLAQGWYAEAVPTVAAWVSNTQVTLTVTDILAIAGVFTVAWFFVTLVTLRNLVHRIKDVVAYNHVRLDATRDSVAKIQRRLRDPKTGRFTKAA